MSFLRSFATAVIVLWAGMALGQESPADPLQLLLFRPEILVQHRERIGLTDEQLKTIRVHVEQTAPTAKEQDAKLKDAIGRLAASLSAEKIDEQVALERLDAVLAEEKQLKHLQMQLLIRIRNELTVDQRKAAAGIQPNTISGKALESRLRAKVSRIEKEVRARAQAQKPPFDAVGLMQKFPELMQRGQVAEAEALLDNVIAMLGLDDDKDAAAKPHALTEKTSGLPEKVQAMQDGIQKKQQKGEDLSKIQDLLKMIGPLLDQNKHSEAEPLVDQVLRLLEGKD